MGSHLSEECSLNKEVTYRNRRASAAFGSLRARVSNNRNLKLSTQVSVYHTLYLSALLYGSETSTLYRYQMKKLEMRHISCLLTTLGITWRDKLTHNEILSRTESNSVEFLAAQRQLRWVSHVIRMENSLFPKQVLYGELLRGKRHQGGQKKRFKESTKATLRRCHINSQDLEVLAQD